MYFPKSQIKTGLYANEGEFVDKLTQIPYIGPYFATLSDKYFTGINPSNSSVEIIPFLEPVTPPLTNIYPEESFTPVFGLAEDQEFNPPPATPSYSLGGNIGDRKNQTYMSLTSIPTTRLIPSPSIPSPTVEEVDLGEYTRYFARHNTHNFFLEINKDTFNNLNSNNPEYAFELYSVTSLPWAISINKNDYEVNKNIVNLKEKKLGWTGFHHFFKNKFDTISKKEEYLYTKGGEFVLPNRTNYIGYYHAMDNGNFMTGKYHGDGMEIILIPLFNPSTIPSTSTSTSQPSSGGGTGGGGGGY